MITVLADGAGRHRLEDVSGRHVGWVRGRAIGFHGMRSEDEALAAVAAAWQPFDTALRRHYFGRPPNEPAWDQLRLVHDGAYEWVTDGRHPLARLHRPASDLGDGDFAIEFVLPSYATEGVVISVAQVVGAALRSHCLGAVGSSPMRPSERSGASEAAASV